MIHRSFLSLSVCQIGADQVERGFLLGAAAQVISCIGAAVPCILKQMQHLREVLLEIGQKGLGSLGLCVKELGFKLRGAVFVQRLCALGEVCGAILKGGQPVFEITCSLGDLDRPLVQRLGAFFERYKTGCQGLRPVCGLRNAFGIGCDAVIEGLYLQGIIFIYLS